MVHNTVTQRWFYFNIRLPPDQHHISDVAKWRQAEEWLIGPSCCLRGVFLDQCQILLGGVRNLIIGELYAETATGIITLLANACTLSSLLLANTCAAIW